jgi:hypothetical protein
VSGASASASASVSASASASMSIVDPAHNESTVAKIPRVLPHERVFPIQIGSELFKLSGASLSSDGEWASVKQLVKTSTTGSG